MTLLYDVIIHRSKLLAISFLDYLCPQAIGWVLNGMMLKGANTEENTMVYSILHAGMHRINIYYMKAHVTRTL